MIDRKRLLSLGYYAKAASFTGSDGHKNFKVEKFVDEATEEKMVKATIWPGPLCFDKTEDEKKQTQSAAFSEEGLMDLVNWMNATEV